MGSCYYGWPCSTWTGDVVRIWVVLILAFMVILQIWVVKGWSACNISFIIFSSPGCWKLCSDSVSLVIFLIICVRPHANTCLAAPFLGLAGWASTRKVKPVWILLKQETVCGCGISWVICKSAPRSRQITMPAPPPLSFLQAGCPSCRPAWRHKFVSDQLSQNLRDQSSPNFQDW